MEWQKMAGRIVAEISGSFNGDGIGHWTNLKVMLRMMMMVVVVVG
jgi:hypothetical protein